MWYIYAIISGFSATLMALLINTKLRNFDALLMTCLFCIIMTLILIGACIVFKKFDGVHVRNFELKDLLALVLTGVCAAVGYVAYFFALKTGPICHVVAIDRLSILYMVFISFIFLNAKFNMWMVLGAIFMLMGSFLITGT